MRVLACASLLVVSACWSLAQTSPCGCGVNPPGKPAMRSAEPYAGAPQDMRPFNKFTKPYHEHYTKIVEYNGAARDVKDPSLDSIKDIPIAFLGPVRNHRDEKLGSAMLNGAQMAIEEANKRGGYCGKPFRLVVHNDEMTWGSSSNEIVKMSYDDDAWGMLGSISGDSTHIALRVSLRSELPMVNSASTDPTIPETTIPWMLNSIQDDRVQSYTLARRIYTELGLQRVAILRVNDRYGRFGVIKFRDASRRLGHPVVIEQKYMPSDTDFARQLRVINDSNVDAVVLWSDAAPAGMILKQMRAMGMKQRVFGSHRVIGEDLIRIAGDAAEGLEAVYPFNPDRNDPSWVSFNNRFRAKYAQATDSFSALAFDTMNILLDSICRAGLNRGRIRDALYGLERYKGVTGDFTFDPNAKNVAPMYLATVKGGKVTYRHATMTAAYATVGESGVTYNGPAAGEAAKQIRIGVFGPGAVAAAARLQRPGVEVIGVSSDQAWGKSSTELVNLVYERGVVALIATDRNSSHLAEQIAVKSFVPLIALSADRTLTSTNIPWIFRLNPNTSVETAVDAIADAARRAGTDRTKVRELLASGSPVGAGLRFASTGEPR